MDAPRRHPLLALLVAAVLALSGCVAVEAPVAQPAQDAPDAPQEAEEEPADPADVEDITIPLDVSEGPGGSTLAFVPVTIRGEGPFPFALDTGASSSVIDSALADELGLVDVAEPEPVQGATGTGEARQLEIDDWQMGEVELGPRVAGGLELAEGGFAGLLGSDVLSEYGTVLVDYTNGVLVLSPRPETVEALGGS